MKIQRPRRRGGLGGYRIYTLEGAGLRIVCLTGLDLFFRVGDCGVLLVKMDLQLDSLRGAENLHRRIASECGGNVKKGTSFVSFC